MVKTHFNTHSCQAILFACIDWRLHPGLGNYFKKETGKFDLCASAGSIKGFIEKESRDFFLRQIEISQKLHESKIVILTMHKDCGAFGGSKNFNDRTKEISHHKDVLESAAEVIERRFPEYKILKYFIDLNQEKNKWRISPKKFKPMPAIAKKNILLSVTTTRGANWRQMIKDIKIFGLKEIALFPTCLRAKERKEMYALLQKSGIKSVPVLHLRTDMPTEELDFFRKKYKTKIFTIHTKREYPLMHDWSAYRSLIYVENVYNVFDEGELKEFGGICLDITHLENDRVVAPKKFKKNFESLKIYPIGANHIAVFPGTRRIDEEGKVRYDSHKYKKLTDFDYLKKYPKRFFSPFLCLELENTLKEQMAAKAYLLKIIGQK